MASRRNPPPSWINDKNLGRTIAAENNDNYEYDGYTSTRQHTSQTNRNKMSDSGGDDAAVDSTNRKRPNVLITGTPGVGKSECTCE
jgi:hypothetical protein